MHNKTAELFKEFRELTIKEATMVADLEKVRGRLKEIEGLVEHGEKESKGVGNQGYRDTWNKVQKALYVINTVGKCISIRDIVEKVKEIENRQNDDAFDKNLMAGLSSTFSGWASKGKIFRYRPYDGADWLYGLPAWFNSAEDPKEEYKPY